MICEQEDKVSEATSTATAAVDYELRGQAAWIRLSRPSG